jgi:integrase
VGRSKTEAGTGRTIPLNGALLQALLDHTRWYAKHFGEVKPEWFVFPGGSRFPKDPARSIGSLKTAWNNVRKKAGVTGRWRDNRHTLITDLAESGAGDETIMEIAGHVSRQMLSRYTHIRIEAKRKALEEVERKRMAAREQMKEASRKRASEKALATPARLQ